MEREINMNHKVTSNIDEVLSNITEKYIQKLKKDYGELIQWREDSIEQNLKMIKKHREIMIFWAEESDDKEIVIHLKNKIEELKRENEKHKEAIIPLQTELNENIQKLK
jgi:hypothetical protein